MTTFKPLALARLPALLTLGLAAQDANSASSTEAMKKAYPDAGLGIALDIGAKVNKGEMKW